MRCGCMEINSNARTKIGLICIVYTFWRDSPYYYCYYYGVKAQCLYQCADLVVNTNCYIKSFVFSSQQVLRAWETILQHSSDEKVASKNTYVTETVKRTGASVIQEGNLILKDVPEAEVSV